MKKLLHKVTHPLIELTFLIDEERILVFNGDVVMDEISADNHFKFCVGELREEIDNFFSTKSSDDSEEEEFSSGLEEAS